MGSPSRIHLLFWTLRYLKPHQIWARLRHNLQRSWWSLRRRRPAGTSMWELTEIAPLYPGLRDISCDGPWRAEADSALLRAREAAEGRLRFLNLSVNVSSKDVWKNPDLSRLLRYHLHYFDYVQDLLVWGARGQSRAAYQAFRSLAGSWMECNQITEGDGWHPYTISLRLVNWLHALEGFKKELSGDEHFRARLIAGWTGQAQVLAGNLESDVGGNHLLANLRALVLAGIVLRGEAPRRWLQRSLTLFEKELFEQVLQDGAHFELSPGYHLTVLRHCLEMAVTMKRNGVTPPASLDTALRRMLEYLVAILPPDSKIPLLKDTTWDGQLSPADLLAAGALYLQEPAFKISAGFGLYPLLLFGREGWEVFQGWSAPGTQRSSVALHDSGHYVMRDDFRGDYLILVAGKPCPDHLPAHAHADLLSYELMVGGQRIVVDSGVYEYAAGPWRDYFRSTRAHNTVEVEEANQSEVWASFRVARRAHPGPVTWLANEDSVTVRASHDGYRRLRVPLTHLRTLVWRRNRFWLVMDELRGKGSTRASSYVHLYPDLEFTEVGESMWRIGGCRSDVWLTAFGAQDHQVIRGRMEPVRQGWYSEKFGELAANSVLALSCEGALPVSFGYVISKEGPAEVHLPSGAADSQVTIVHHGEQFRFETPGAMAS
ncbi:MAG TPA: alginate lyase family protein [Acidobacteriota bacterium]|nr:alginate lyase family protein [Acidobacteriota bacterium]